MFPPSPYHSILLSLLLFASPGGLHHLIWLNEEVDLRLSVSPELFPVPPHGPSPSVSWRNTSFLPHAHLLLSPHILISDEISLSLCSLFAYQIPSFLVFYASSPHFSFLSYLKPWQCMCRMSVCVHVRQRLSCSAD